MNVVHSDQPVDVSRPSIFLAGPTPRSPDVKSWRPEALDLLRNLGFGGTVLVPERRDGWTRGDYLDQVEWEFAALEGCTVIAFRVPRDPATLPGFTTNVEFGRYVGSGAVRLRKARGYPAHAVPRLAVREVHRQATGEHAVGHPEGGRSHRGP